MTRSLLYIVLASVAMASTHAFSPSIPVPVLAAEAAGSCTVPASRPLMMAVLDVDSEAEFDKKISSAGDALVIIDYSTTWCGPCKVCTTRLFLYMPICCGGGLSSFLCTRQIISNTFSVMYREQYLYCRLSLQSLINWVKPTPTPFSLRWVLPRALFCEYKWSSLIFTHFSVYSFHFW